jgi:hypothetical protein
MIARVSCTIFGLMLLGGCGINIVDTFKPAPDYTALEQPVPDDPRLARILYSAAGTPGHQGFLYVAMVEAEVASQYAGYALAANDLTTVKNAIGDVLYAIDPTTAPTWRARSAGLVQEWAGRGYGLRRALREMQDEVRAIAGGRAESDALAQGAARAVACADTMLARADRIVVLGGQVLAGNAVADLRPTLEQIDRLTQELYYGTANLETDRQALTQCGLQETRLLLQAMTPVTA